MQARKTPFVISGFSLGDALSSLNTTALEDAFPATMRPSIRLSRKKAPLLLADADVAAGTIKYLHYARLYVSDVRGLLPSRHPDEDVLALAKKSSLLLITHDTDFADSIRFDPVGSRGIVLLPSAGQHPGMSHAPQHCPQLRQALDRFLEDLSGRMDYHTGALHDYRCERPQRHPSFTSQVAQTL